MKAGHLSRPITRELFRRGAFGAVAGLEVHYQRWILNPDGSVAFESDRKHNLIVDAGLDKVAADYWANLTSVCVIGTGALVVRRDSGATNLSRAGNTLSSDAAFFVSQDVGRRVKMNSGEEMKVTAFTDAQNVTVDQAGAIAAGPGTVWYTNLTGLVTETKRTNTFSTGGGDCGSSFSVDTWSFKRTYLFSAEAAPIVYHELGWANTMTAGANLFGLDAIAGVGDSLATGQQYKVAVTLTLKFSPATPTAVADFGNNGFVTAGTQGFRCLIGGANYNSIDVVGSDGGHVAGSQSLEPSNPGGGAGKMRLATANWTQGNATSSQVNSPAGLDASTNSAAVYTNGTYYRDFTSAWTVAQTGTIYGIIVGQGTEAFSVLFTAPQTKDGSHTLTVVFRLSWNRVLTN